MSADDRILRRTLERERVAALLASDAFRDSVIANLRGEVLSGDPVDRPGVPSAIRCGERIVGEVWGTRAAEFAEILGAILDLGAENRALARESLDKYRELNMLYNVSERMLGAPDAKQVAALACCEARRFLAADGIGVLVLNDETGRLELVETTGRAYHSRSSIEVGGDVVGHVMRSGVGEIVNDVGTDPRPMQADNAFRSIVCSPLKSRNRVLGVIVVGSESARQYSAGDLQLLNALASQAAGAIDVARLYGALATSSAKPADLIYGLNDRPPAGALAVLAGQHVVVASITLVVPVLIALEGGLTRHAGVSVVGMSLIAMGIVTLLQAGRIGPIGSGYLAPQITSTIYLPPSLLAAQAGGMGMVFGMTFVAGIFGLLLSQVVGRLRKLFPPEVCGVVVSMIGFSIIRAAWPRFLGADGAGGTLDTTGLLVGVVTLATMVGLSIISLGQVRLYAAVIGVVVGYATGIAAGVVDSRAMEAMLERPWFGVPAWQNLDLAFSPTLMPAFLVAAIASSIKSVGLITSAQKANDSNWKRPDMASIRGGLVADGIGNLCAGLLGGTATAIGAGNVGLAAATGATARRIAVVAGVMFIALAFVPKVTEAIALMPAPVMGAGLLFVACFLVVSGLSLVVSRLLDTRRTFIVGLSMLAGIGLDLMPNAFAGAPSWAIAILGSPLAFATALAVGLNLLLSVGVSKKARLELPVDGAWQEEVLRFFERWGAAWGARPDVIRRAGPAVVEWCEETATARGGSTMLIEVTFDEFRLTIDVRERGSCEGADTLALERVIGHLQRRYDCRARTQNQDDAVHVNFEFVH